MNDGVTVFSTFSFQLKSSPTRLTILVLGLLLILYTGWLIYVIKADRPLDFYVYYMAAEAALREQNPYTISNSAWDTLAQELGITNYTRPYRYPPHTAALLAIFHPLGPTVTMILWVSGNALAMIGGVWLIGRILSPAWWLPLSLTSLLFFVPPLATLLAGQVNGLLFFSLAVALWAISQQKPIWLGTSLAAGAALKVIPLALILYLFWRRQWLAGAIGIIALGLLTLASVMVVGWEGLVAYAQNAILLGTPNTVHGVGANQTITAVLGGIFPSASEQVLTASRWLGLLVIGATVILCWPKKLKQVEIRGREKETYIADLYISTNTMTLEFGLIVAALQLIPPFTWYHQLVLLLIPFLFVAHYLWIKQAWKSLGILILLFILSDIHGLAWHYLPGPWLRLFPFLLGVYLWSVLAIILSGKWRMEH